MKRIISPLLALSLLFSLSVAALAAAGSSEDPLISESYITDTYKPGITAAVREAIEKQLGGLLTDRSSGFTGGSDTGSFKLHNLGAGATIGLSFGDSVIMSSGEALISVKEGTVLDLTAGKEIDTNTRLVTGSRYFAAEGSSAVVTATSAGFFLCDGEVEITQGQGSAATFSDVSPSHWAFVEIEALSSRGIVNGRGDGSFGISLNMTRADFVTVLGRMHGVDANSGGSTAFADVNAAEYYAPYVAWASVAGIVTGYSDTAFGPKDSITREQMAAIIIRYTSYAGIELPTNQGSGSFSDDARISLWAYDMVYAARNAGLIRGKDGNLFDPAGTAGRAEISVIIYRLLQI